MSISRATRAEPVCLDSECLERLYERLGFHDADHLVCRAVDELAQRVAQCTDLWQKGDWQRLNETARCVHQLATQIGMPVLARVARDVSYCVNISDRPALDATLDRMTRLGEAALKAMWGQQDLSI
jgi:hypothetical protein